jgi:predicted transcriptional regulator
MVERKKMAPVFRPEEKGLRKVFGELETAIMECLWDRGQATVSEVYKALATQRGIAYTTVKTVMERLAAKGYLHSDSRRRAYVYTPTQSRDDVLRQVSETIFTGLLNDFGEVIAAHLLEETVRQCDQDTLDRLHALIEARRAADRGPQQEP